MKNFCYAVRSDYDKPTLEKLKKEIKLYKKALKEWENSNDDGRYLCPKLKRRVDYRLKKMDQIGRALKISFQDKIKLIQEIN